MTRRLFNGVWSAWMLAILSCTPGWAGDVVVLTTDGSVERYARAAEGFKEAWAAHGKAQSRIHEIDLGAVASNAASTEERLRASAPSPVYCIGSKAYLLACQSLDPSRTILLSSAINWQRFPTREQTLVVATELAVESEVTLFKYFFPGIRRIGVLCSKKYNEEWAREALRIAEGANVTLDIRLVDASAAVPGELGDLLEEVDAFWLIADPIVLKGEGSVREIFSLARAAGKPVFAYSVAFADSGAALMVAPDDLTIGKQAAGLLIADEEGKARRGTAQRPVGSEVALNLRVVKECELELNEEALDSVNRIIR